MYLWLIRSFRWVNNAIDMQLAIHHMTTHGNSWALHGVHVCWLAYNSAHALLHCDVVHMMLMYHIWYKHA